MLYAADVTASITLFFKPRRPEITIMAKTKILLYFDANAITDFKLREKLYSTKSQICKINADRLNTKTIVK